MTAGLHSDARLKLVKIAATDLADGDLDDFYYGCLMGMREGVTCPEIEIRPGSQPSSSPLTSKSMEKQLRLFQPNCQQNYDNFDMCYQAIYPLVRREQNRELAAGWWPCCATDMFDTDNPTPEASRRSATRGSRSPTRR